MRANVKATMATVTAAASDRTATLGGWNDAAKRKRQYGVKSSSATKDLATNWWVTRVGSILTVRESPPMMAKESATIPRRRSGGVPTAVR